MSDRNRRAASLLTLVMGSWLLPASLSAQAPALPGLNDKYDTEAAIQKLMEAERIPLERMTEEKKAYQDQKNAWIRLNQRISTVRDAARQLYGFQNPFSSRLASSSDEGVLAATADRGAKEQQLSVRVKQLAAADRFISRSLPLDFSVPAGTYRFKVGDQEVKFSFRGGSLRDLAEAINTRAGKLLKASVVNDSKTSQVIVIESLKTGAKNLLSFYDQAAAFGEKAGILERSLEASRPVAIDRQSVQPWGKPLEEQELSIAEGTLTLEPGAEARLPLSPPQLMKPNLVLSMQLRVQRLPEEPYREPTPPQGPALPEVGGIDFEGVHVESAPSKTVLPEWQPPEPPKHVDDLQVLFLLEKGREVPLPPVQDSGEFYTLELPAGELPAQIDALAFRNRNTHRIVEVRDIRIYDKTARGEYRAVKPLASAQDSVIVMDGVEVTRDSNDIGDLVEGVTLNLRGLSDRPVTLTVQKDVEAIKEALISFIGYYNQLLVHTDILTRDQEDIIENALFLNDQEKEQARAELGLLKGNTTLMQLKSSLQRFMMDPYPTDGGRELSLLAQAGISTSGGQFQTSGSVDRTRLRGYLQIEEGKLEDALARMGEWVRQLFGNDTDRDLVVDTGAAYKIDGYLRAYAETGGIVANRVAALDRSIASKSSEITKYNDHLADYERELRRKFGTMQSALDELEQSSQALDNFNKRSQ
jgi:flagellar hook-associated protein 2